MDWFLILGIVVIGGLFWWMMGLWSALFWEDMGFEAEVWPIIGGPFSLALAIPTFVLGWIYVGLVEPITEGLYNTYLDFRRR